MSLTHEDAPVIAVDELDEQAGADLFEAACQRRLGVAAVDFLTAYDDGELPADWPMREVVELEMLLPFAR